MIRAVMKARNALKKIAEKENHFYPLDRPVSITLSGGGCADIIGSAETETRDGSLSISVNGDELVTVTAHPFTAESKLWNGPNLIKDDKLRSMYASLFHDLIWGHADELADLWGVDRLDVLEWGNGVLYAAWCAASNGSWLGQLEARVAYGLCQVSAPWWTSLKKWFGIACLGGLLLVAPGCGTPPDWKAELDGLDVVRQVIDGKPAAEPKPEAPASADEVPFAELAWERGGFRGGGAQIVEGCVIADLGISGSRLSYRWISGGCELLGGASGPHDANCICALFVHRGGRWVGGKFDWISTDRTTRGLENIHGNYHGWSSADLAEADGFAFVIVSRDGRRRTNVIRAAK